MLPEFFTQNRKKAKYIFIKNQVIQDNRLFDYDFFRRRLIILFMLQ